jgi:hypothetical protein
MITGFLYFLALIVFGQIIMLNLFLAIVLGTFDTSRFYLNKIQKLEEIKRLRKYQKLPISVVLLRTLGGLGAHINETVLKRNPEEDMARL